MAAAAEEYLPEAGQKEGRHGVHIPFLVAPKARDGTDKQGNPCRVLDFAVHPSTYAKAQADTAFKVASFVQACASNSMLGFLGFDILHA